MKNRRPITSFFDRVLNAPLHSPRQSWGAVSRLGDRVVLRVWEDERKGHEVLVFKARHGLCFGRDERLRHIRMIEAGIPFALVMCVRNPEEPTNSVLHYVESRIFTGTQIRWDKVTGDVYVIYDKVELV